jgi:hypothetical protein
LRFNVLIYQDNLPVASCKGHDLGLDGLCLRSRNVRFGKHTTLEVEFSLRIGDEWRTIRIPAMVIHARGDTMGLMFADTGFKVRSLLRNVVYQDTDMRSFSTWPAAPAPVTA